MDHAGRRRRVREGHMEEVDNTGWLHRVEWDREAWDLITVWDLIAVWDREVWDLITVWDREVWALIAGWDCREA